MQFYPDYGAAIAGIESAGQTDPYAALGPVTKNGDRAHGRYQIMGVNIPDWSEQYLGQRMTPQELLSHPETAKLQDAIFNGRFGDYIQQYGNPQDAASAWFTGKPMAEGANRSDVNGTTGSAYVDKFNRNLAQQSGGSPMAAAFSAEQPPMARVMDQNGVAKPDADGVYGADAVMLPGRQQSPIMEALNKAAGGGGAASLDEVSSQAKKPTGEVPDLFPNSSRRTGLLGGALGPDFGSKLGSLGAAMVSISNPSAGANLMQNAKDMRTQNMTRDAQEATYRSLVARGVPPAEASAAALNPDIMKAVAGKYFDAKPLQPVDMGTDPITGMKKFGVFNSSTGQWMPSNGPAGANGQPGSLTSSSNDFDINAFQKAQSSGASPEDLKKMLPPILRSEVESMIKGEASAMTLSRSGPARNAVMMIAHAVDPTFDETTFQARQTLAKGLAQVSPSSFGGMKTSANMVIHHLDDLDKAIDGLPNTNIPALNAIGNWGSQQAGNKAVQTAVRNFEQKREVVATELPKFLRGAGAAEADVEHIRKTISSSDSPEALRTAVRGFIGSIRGRLEPMVDTYNNAYKRNETADYFLGPKEREIVKRLEGSLATDSASAPVAASGGFKVIKVH